SASKRRSRACPGARRDSAAREAAPTHTTTCRFRRCRGASTRCRACATDPCSRPQRSSFRGRAVCATSASGPPVDFHAIDLQPYSSVINSDSVTYTKLHIMTTSKLRWIAAIVLAAPALVMSADYPDRPIRFITPAQPGGTTDILARLTGAKLTEVLKQQVI